MVLEKLGENIRNSLAKISSKGFLDEKTVNELVKDIQRALLQADVNVKLVFSLGKNIKERALKEKPPVSVSKKDFLVHVVYDELVKFVGKGDSTINVEEKAQNKKSLSANKSEPFTILLVGLFGNGKTTTTGKLGKYFKKRGKKVALVSIDTWRPAAFIQLQQLGKSIGVDVYGKPELNDSVKIYKTFQKDLEKYDVVLVDSAGRDALNEELVEELAEINKVVNADETLLVLNADIGQSAEKQARAFHEECNITGVIITKLDGTARGGGALVACAVTGTPIKFIGVGEKIDALEKFNPEGFIGQLLGMGDLEGLLDRVQEAFTEEDLQDTSSKFMKGDFNLLDLYTQMKSMKKMGSLSKIMGMIPGMSNMNIPKDMLEGQEEKLEDWKIIMSSMTKEELEHPEVIRGNRLERIAEGSGQNLKDLRMLLKQHKQSKKMAKMMKGMNGSENDMKKMMQKMQKGGTKKLKF